MNDDHQSSSLPIACTLTADEFAAGREGLLPELLARAKAQEPVPGGFRWQFSPDAGLLIQAAAVIDAERRCCRFLTFALRVEADGGPMWLEVTGPAGTEDFLSSLVSAP